MKTKIFLALFCVAVLFGSCQQNTIYSSFQPISTEGWHQATSHTFDVEITDTLAAYNIYVNVRNNNEYPYQNLWLFLEQTQPDGTQTQDTIECYLADQRGKWLGSGVGAIREMPILYQQQVRFNASGTYKYSIVQGMREEVLIGINDIGMRVEKFNE